MYVCISINMGVKTIYLPDELCIKLKQEENISGLISRLLNDYYKVNQVHTKEELMHITEEIEYKQKHSVQELEKEKEVIVNQIQVIETDAEIAEKARIKATTKKQEFWNTCKSNLNELSNNIITDEIIDEYVERFNNDPGLNMYEFIAEKGL